MAPGSQNGVIGLEDCRLGSQAGPSLKKLLEGRERLKTGFPELDRALGGGIPVPNLAILGAKPKCGKSTLLLAVARYVVTYGHGYAYIVDLENGLIRLLARLMCSMADTDPDALGRDSFEPTPEWELAKEEVMAGELSRRLFLEKEQRISYQLLEDRVAEISNMARAAGRPFVVLLDSLQKLATNLQDRRASIDGWMRELERIREKYGAVIIVASELKRPQQGTSYKPSEVALKESGDIEYCADLVLTLDRQEDGDNDFATCKPPDPATMRILFNRDGQTGRVARYGLVYPYHKIQEIPFPENKVIRKPYLVSSVPDLEA